MDKRRKLVSITQLQSGEVLGIDSNGDTWTHLEANDIHVQKWVKSDLAYLPQGVTGDPEIDDAFESLTVS